MCVVCYYSTPPTPPPPHCQPHQPYYTQHHTSSSPQTLLRYCNGNFHLCTSCGLPSSYQQHRGARLERCHCCQCQPPTTKSLCLHCLTATDCRWHYESILVLFLTYCALGVIGNPLSLPSQQKLLVTNDCGVWTPSTHPLS